MGLPDYLISDVGVLAPSSMQNFRKVGINLLHFLLDPHNGHFFWNVWSIFDIVIFLFHGFFGSFLIWVHKKKIIAETAHMFYLMVFNSFAKIFVTIYFKIFCAFPMFFVCVCSICTSSGGVGLVHLFWWHFLCSWCLRVIQHPILGYIYIAISHIVLFCYINYQFYCLLPIE